MIFKKSAMGAILSYIYVIMNKLILRMLFSLYPGSGGDCQKNQLWGPLYFQNEATILHRHVFIAINIPYIFGEDIFIN